jgi:hypothetical protein
LTEKCKSRIKRPERRIFNTVETKPRPEPEEQRKLSLSSLEATDGAKKKERDRSQNATQGDRKRRDFTMRKGKRKADQWSTNPTK